MSECSVLLGVIIVVFVWHVLQVTCTVSGLDWLSVVRVEKHDELVDRTTVITDSGNVKYPFSELSRYSVNFEQIDEIGVGIVSIYYQGTYLFAYLYLFVEFSLKCNASGLLKIPSQNIVCCGHC